MPNMTNVTFSMSAGDLEFLIWAMDYIKKRYHDQKEISDYWRLSFQHALEKNIAEEGKAENNGHLPSEDLGDHGKFYINLFIFDDNQRYTLEEMGCSLNQRPEMRCVRHDLKVNSLIVHTEGGEYEIHFEVDNEGFATFGRIISGDISDSINLKNLVSAFNQIGWRAFREEKR